MGSALSKNEACLVWCGMEDDSYPELDARNDYGPTIMSLTEDASCSTETEVCPALASPTECRCSVL